MLNVGVIAAEIRQVHDRAEVEAVADHATRRVAPLLRRWRSASGTGTPTSGPAA